MTSARALFSALSKIVDADEQEEPVARWRLVWTHQGGVLVRAPLVEAEQDGSIRIVNLAEVVVARNVSDGPKSDWYHVKLAETSRTPIIVHVRFIA